MPSVSFSKTDMQSVARERHTANAIECDKSPSLVFRSQWIRVAMEPSRNQYTINELHGFLHRSVVNRNADLALSLGCRKIQRNSSDCYRVSEDASHQQ